MTADPVSGRKARAERLGDYFEIQLRLAAHIGARTGLPLAEAVPRYTNFHRRFGFGAPDTQRAAAWQDYAGPLRRLKSIAEQVAWTQEFFLAAPEETLPAHQRFFGSFGFDAPDAQGIVRIHFVNQDKDGVGPLQRSKVDLRKAELAALFSHVRAHHPDAAAIRGISWLYHLDAYRRLFPPAHGQSATPARRVRLSGTSSWGQFLKHDETIKPHLRDMFLRNFAGMDVAAPWRSFPLPPLVAQAPLTAFDDFYGQQGPR